MQLNVPVHSREYRKLGINPHSLEGNVALGTRELVSHLPSRGGYNRKIKVALGRYNGCGGANSGYSKKVMRVFHRLQNNSPEELSKYMHKHGDLWN